MPRERNGDYARLEALLAEDGVSVPPLPSDAVARLKERAEWCFSTRAFKESPEELKHYVRKAIAGASPDYALIARMGPGPGSRTLYYFLVQGPLQVFLEIGEASQRTRDRWQAAANECFARARELAAAVPQAVRMGRLSRTGRLTVVGSDRGESFWEVAAAGERAVPHGRLIRAAGRDRRTPCQMLEEAVRWCRGGSVSA